MRWSRSRTTECSPTDDTYLEYGQFNGGFVATGRDEHGFLDFWKSIAPT